MPAPMSACAGSRRRLILDAIREHKVSHYCGAPIVHSMLINAPAEWRAGINHKVSALVAAAPPPASMIEGMNRIGFDITHVYGLTETYGPAAVCAKHRGVEQLPLEEQVRLNGRQGVRYHLQEGVTVMDPDTMQPVPRDGETMGEIMFRGNITMKGYLKNPKATEEAFRGGWYHSGDLAVMQPDGYVKIKDRSKDVIISGGENISSVEVEDVLYRHRRGAGGGGGGHARSEVGRGALRLHRAEGGRPGDGGGVHRVLPRAHGALQGAEESGVRPAAEDLHRQDPEIRPAREGEVDAGHRIRRNHECSTSCNSPETLPILLRSDAPAWPRSR
jgi:acyl-CoA synthetase (AMP-forming)/AMP-acid ligase II